MEQNNQKNAQSSQHIIHAEIPEQIKAGVYSNAVSVTVTGSEVVIDFGYLMPNTGDEKKVKIVSRVNMTTSSAENLLSTLQNAILDHKEKQQ